MSEEPRKQTPPRKVVVDSGRQIEPVPAKVVRDATDTNIRRLSLIGLVLLLIGLSLAGLIQSAKNGAKLDDARRQLHQANSDNSVLIRTVQAQNQYIIELQKALLQQANSLIKAGHPELVVPLPPPPVLPLPGTSGPGATTPSPSPSPSVTEGLPVPSPTPRSPPPSPTSPPSPRPTPTRTPVVCKSLAPELGTIVVCI